MKARLSPSLLASAALLVALFFPSVARPDLPSRSPYTMDNVVIDHFQARGAPLSEVLEALSVLSYNASGHHYRPTFVVVGSDANSRLVSLNIPRGSISSAVERLGEHTGLLVTQRNDSVIFSPRK